MIADCFVTGASGFIGSHLCKALTEKKLKVVALVRDIFPSPWGKWLEEALENCILVRGDVTDFHFLKRVLSQYEPKQVLHFAAQSLVSVAQKEPFGTFQTNVLGSVALLDACRQLDIETVYVQSTDKAYGDRMNAKEDDPLVSTGGIYSTSKSCEDLIAQSFIETYGLNIIIGRACNCFGFDMAPRIVSNTIRSCLRGEPPIIYEGEETLRQYIHVSDLVEAILFLTRNKHKGIFNIATNDVLSQDLVVKKICNFFPISPRLVKRNKPLKEIQKQSMNWDKIKMLGWKPKLTFEEGIKQTIERFQIYGF